MRSWLFTRLLIASLSLLGIIGVSFVLLHLAPGAPVPAGFQEGGERSDAAALAALSARYGLDQPLPERFVRWTARALRLDFGTSFVDHRPVRDRILERLPRTVALNAAALLIILIGGLGWGLYAARHPGSRLDRLGSPLIYAGAALPSFWVALLLQGGLALGLGLFPLSGDASPGAAGLAAPARLLDALWHLALPAFCLAVASVAFVARFTRAHLLETLSSPFLAAGRARGLPASRLLWRHALGAGRLPFLTLAGLLAPTLVSGSVIVERVFAWPGIGSLLFDSLNRRDYPTLLGLTVLSASLVLVATVLVDLLSFAVEPRLRRPGSAS